MHDLIIKILRAMADEMEEMDRCMGVETSIALPIEMVDVIRGEVEEAEWVRIPTAEALRYIADMQE